MQRIGVLNGENITYDHDISGLVRGLTSGGIIQGGNVVGGKLQPVQAVIELQRSNGQKMLSFFESDETITLPTSGDHKVYIEANQAKIDDGTGNAVNGSGIAEIKTGTSRPTKNFLKLASITNGTITDERAIIPKIQEVKQQADQLSSTVATHTGQIAELQEAGAIDHLEEVGIVGEAYDMNDTLFLQKTPTEADSIIPLNIGDVANNTRREIQRISNGQSFNSVELIVDKVGAPTTDCIIEVYEGVEVTVSTKEKYWKKTGSVLATGSIAYDSIATTKAKKTFSLNKSVQKPEGTKLIILVKQTNAIVNASNHYRIYADSTQYSEAFSDVLWNGSSYTREKLMPYCVSEGFAQGLLCKVGEDYTASGFESELAILEQMMKDAPTNRTPNHIISIPTEATEIRVKGNIISSISNYQGNVFISDTLSQGAPGELGTIYLSRGIGEFEQSFTKAKTATMHIFARSGTGATQSMGRSYLNIYVRNPLLKKSSGLELFPLLSSSIGKKASATSFGAHSDGTRKGGWINTSLSTTATTGNIAPANGVGYMSITGEDGKKYKVLVYGD